MTAFEGQNAYAGAFAAGVALHMLFFRVGEWDRETTTIVLAFFGLNLAAVFGLVRLLPEPYSSIGAAVSDAGKLSLAMVLGIYLSMLVYRAFFHRLRNFPGPLLARLSNFYATYLATKKLHLFLEVEKLHNKYGDFVRLGPQELSVAHPDALSIIHAATSSCMKGPWYSAQEPMVSLHSCRDKVQHTKRRKVWDRGFSGKALRDYEPRVAHYTEQLVEAIEKGEGQPVDANKWFNFYSFDVMGDLAFGRSFEMLQKGEEHYYMKTLHHYMQAIGIFSHMSWLFPIMQVTPIVNAESLQYLDWLKKAVDQRKKNKPQQPDVFAWLLEDYESRSNVSKQDELNLIADASLIAVAGSDTTAAALTCVFHQLALHPAARTALQKEVDEYYTTNPSFESTSLAKLSYLEAVLNETLRLDPPVPGGVQRVTPPQGLQVGDTYIPGHTIVQVPLHTVMRDERNFKQANEFIPERWTSREDLLIKPENYAPFSIGKYGCIGKNLALMELRRVTAQLVHKYDFKLAPNQTSEAFLDGKMDTFTLTLAPLEMVFSPRANKM